MHSAYVTTTAKQSDWILRKRLIGAIDRCREESCVDAYTVSLLYAAFAFICPVSDIVFTIDITFILNFQRLSSTNLKLENNGHAIRDADEAIKLDQACIKVGASRAAWIVHVKYYNNANSTNRPTIAGQAQSMDQ